MILSFDRVGELLDEMAEGFPQAFFNGLNGGILLLPEPKPDPDFPDGELYIMGEYCDDQMGKYINIHYGSFAAFAKLEDWSEEDWAEELHGTLAHEFTHHIEGLAGAHGLDDKDAAFMADFLAQYAGEDEEE